jgi:hypothetical protein
MQVPNEPSPDDQALKRAIQRRFAEDAEVSRPLDEAARRRIVSLFDTPPSLAMPHAIDASDAAQTAAPINAQINAQINATARTHPPLRVVRYAALLVAGVAAFWVARYQYHEFIEHRTIDRNVAVVYELATQHLARLATSPDSKTSPPADPAALLYRIDPNLVGDPLSITKQKVDHPNAATPEQIAVIAQYQVGPQHQLGPEHQPGSLSVTLIQLPLATLVSIPDYPDYDQTVGELRLVGKTMGDHMVCIIVASTTPPTDVDRLLASVQAVTAPN